MSDSGSHEDESNEDRPSAGLLNDVPIAPATPLRGTRSVFARASVFMAFHFSIAFSEMVLVAPMLSLFERSLCTSYYSQHDPSLIGSGGWVDESHCKFGAIQADLATIRGWKSFFDTLPVFLVAIPIGKLADKYSRKKLMVVNLLGVMGALLEILLVCMFPLLLPLRLVWLSSFILLCGGGLYTSAALMWAMVSAAFAEEDRSQAFYYIFSAFYIAELVGSTVASATIDFSPWIGCILALFFVFCALSLLPIMPQSDAKASLTMNTTGNAESQTGESSLFGQKETTLRQAVSNRNLLLSIPVFLVGALRYTVLNILMQYTSIRFGWPISRTALIYTEAAVVTITLFLILVPWATTMLRSKSQIRASTIDLVMVRSSVSLLCIGALCLSFSVNSVAIFFSVLVYASGFGSRVSMLALISYWTSESSAGTFYTAIAVLENIGHAFGDPSLQNIFAAVLGRADRCMALPFFVAFGLYGVVAICTFSMQTRRQRTQ